MVLTFASNFEYFSLPLSYKSYRGNSLSTQQITFVYFTPRKLLPLISSSPRDIIHRLLNSPICDIQGPMEMLHQTQRGQTRNADAQSHHRNNVRYVPGREGEGSRQLEEDRQSSRNECKERGAQLVSTTASPLSTRSICSPSRVRRSRPRCEVFSMLEYLTLSQLEDMWRQQDAYEDYVDMPQRTRYLVPINDGTQHTSPDRDVDQEPNGKRFSLSNMAKDQVLK